MRPRIFFGLLLLAIGGDAAANELYDTINELRAGAGECGRAGESTPLTRQPALERAAGALTRGYQLQPSLDAAGYRATRSSALSIKGDGIAAQVPQILATASYCKALQTAGMSEVGVYEDAHQVWIVMAAPFAPAVRMSEQAAGQRVLALANQARATPRACGGKAMGAARPLRWNDALALASRVHAEDMARNNYFSHGGRDGSNPAQRVERAGYRFRATGENIAAGQLQPEDAVAGWIRSPPHCANLMNPAFTDMGVAYAVDAGSKLGVYWAQAFGAPR